VLIFNKKTLTDVGKSFEIIDHIEIKDLSSVDDDLIDDSEDKDAWGLYDSDTGTNGGHTNNDTDTGTRTKTDPVKADGCNNDSGTELERSWNGVGAETENNPNITNNSTNNDTNNKIWSCGTRISGGRGSNCDNQSNSNSSNNTEQSIKDLQKSSSNNKNTTDTPLDDTPKNYSSSSSVPVPFQDSDGIERENNVDEIDPIQVKNSVPQLQNTDSDTEGTNQTGQTNDRIN